MAKIGRALVNGVTGSDAVEGAEQPLAVKPQSFKALVGKGHPEFSSPRQQVSVYVNKMGMIEFQFVDWI